MARGQPVRQKVRAGWTRWFGSESSSWLGRLSATRFAVPDPTQDSCTPTVVSDPIGSPDLSGRLTGSDPAGVRRQVGPYLLVEPIGAGSQAVVWRAIRTEPPGGPVALKLLTPGRGHDLRRVARLRREAERGARLSNPYLLPVLDFDQTDGVVYLVMPVVEGGSLGDVIQQRRNHRGRHAAEGARLARIPEAQYFRTIAFLLARVALGLRHAHESQVVHRDIKPSNILLDQDQDDHPYLTDFGLGRDLDVATPAQLRDRSGTPLYMAPEKLRGESCDERLCDLYALGVTLFEAATLAPPFRLPPLAPVAVLALHLAYQNPLRPRAIAPRLPRELEAIIQRAMHPEPDRRYPTAGALAEALEQFGGNRLASRLRSRPSPILPIPDAS